MAFEEPVVAPAHSQPATDAPVPMPKARLMVVEDEALVARDIQGRLRAMGYQVVMVCTGPDEAVVAAQELEPDLILMDINLNAKRDGVEAAAEIRRRKDIPIIFCTAYSNDEVLQRAKITAPYGYTLKPFDNRELEINIEIALFKHRIELKRRRDAARLAAAMNSIEDAVIACDPNGEVFLFNPQAQAILRISEAYAVGSRIDDLLHLRDPDGGRERIRIIDGVIGEGREYHNARQRLINARGEEVPVEVSATHIDSDDGSLAGVVIAFRDIAQQLAYEEQIARNAFVEPLTGLPNRRVFMDRLTMALRVANLRPDSQCAVLFIDLDRFRLINDGLGHENGDEVLKRTAGRIQRAIRDVDTLTRLSADTFVCLLDPIESAQQALDIASLIQAAVARDIKVREREIKLTATVGIALSNAMRYQDPAEMLRDADTVMHQAKQRGPGSQLVFDSGMHETAVKFLEWESGLQRAVERGELAVYYQPIVESGTNRIVALEALLRWHSDRLGTIAPEEFIPVAESNGLIVPIGEFVTAEVCRQMKAWREAELPEIEVAINLSAGQFIDANLMRRISRVLSEHELRPSRLHFEITESAAMADVETSVKILREFKALGVRIALDDFGTGYSSLTYLKQLPIHMLKIDRSFVTDIVGDADDQTIAKAIIAMGHELRLKVLAEGVESAEQAALLEDFGCDLLQGFHFGHPVPAEAITPMLRSQESSRARAHGLRIAS